MLELDQSAIGKNGTTITDCVALATELDVLSTLGDNTRWSNKENIFSLFPGELSVARFVDNA